MRAGRNPRIIQALLLTLALLATTLVPGALPSVYALRDASEYRLVPAAPLLSVETVADFDGDRVPDRAELYSQGFLKDIRLTLSSPWVADLHFSSEVDQAGSLYAADIDLDSDNDLVWVSDLRRVSSALWLNNGGGVFTRIADTAGYSAAIDSLAARESRTRLFTTTVGGGPKAIGASRYSALVSSPTHLPEFSVSSPLPASFCGAADLSPCVTRYPKRGPPSPPIYI